MGKLTDKVIIVSGSGRGIGRELALAAAAEGARVVVNDRDVDKSGASNSPAEITVRDIVATGGQAVADHGDISTANDVNATVQLALDHFGRLDGVVNNAGILRDRMIFSMEDDDWDAVMRVHLRGHFLLTRAACQHWRKVAKKSGAPARGHVVCVSSEAGIYGHAGQANYSAAKGGIASFSLVVAREMQRYGVTCNTVAPRARTRMTESAFDSLGDGDGPHLWDAQNVAPLVNFLLADTGSSYTGQTFVAGGGVLQVIASPRVAHEVSIGETPLSQQEIAEFVQGALGAAAETVVFPDLGLSSLLR